MRTYQPIWEKLKDLSSKEESLLRKGVSVRAHPAHHKRIVKAVTKEKYNDVAWKLTIEPQKSSLSFTVESNVITFYLRKSLSSMDLEL